MAFNPPKRNVKEKTIVDLADKLCGCETVEEAIKLLKPYIGKGYSFNAYGHGYDFFSVDIVEEIKEPEWRYKDRVDRAKEAYEERKRIRDEKALAKILKTEAAEKKLLRELQEKYPDESGSRH